MTADEDDVRVVLVALGRIERTEVEQAAGERLVDALREGDPIGAREAGAAIDAPTARGARRSWWRR